MTLEEKQKSLDIGNKGEKVAANFLLAQGYEIISANFANDKGYRLGEIDLIVKNKKGVIIFVEVKTRKNYRSSSNKGIFPENAITPEKIKKIEKAANVFLKLNNLLNVEWRIDAVSVIFNYTTRKMTIKHIKYIRI